jgi:hypothetical protein
MPVMDIKIPDPVITVEIEHKYVEHGGDIFAWSTFNARVMVGGVVVFERWYTTNDDRYGKPEYLVIDSDEEAREKVLEAFGKRLKEVLA